jgi:hypothetical protein
LQDPTKFVQIAIFGLKIYHLATLYVRIRCGGWAKPDIGYSQKVYHPGWTFQTWVETFKPGYVISYPAYINVTNTVSKSGKRLYSQIQKLMTG